KLSPLPSDYLVPPPTPPTVAVSHRREFRGVWLTSVWNVNFPSQKGLDRDAQQQELRKMLDLAQALNLNAVIWQVRPQGDTLYASAREPWSSWLMGRQGKPPTPYYDPLEFFIAECHKRNLEAHAWINLYRAATNRDNDQNIPPHFDALYPDAVHDYGKERWMDPGLELAQNHTYEIVLDIVQRYDIDGLHIDDYFYPYPVQGEEFPDQATYQAYQENGGTLSLGDWRRENINTIIRRLGEGIRAAKPHVKFGVSPFGIYRPGQPDGINGLDQYNTLYADPKQWLAEGWVDYLAPQLYWKIDQKQQSYPVLLQWWTEQNPHNLHLYVGNNLVRLTNNFWEVEEYQKQVEISRSFSEQQSLGNIFYHIKPLLENWSEIQQTFRQLYPQPALVPVMAYKGGQPPAVPQTVKVVGNELLWEAKDASEVRCWTLYRLIEGEWRLKTIFPANRRKTPVASGTYALCTVNRLAQESEGVRVTV
ncbi:MAG: family 10 glycosylhydrolase, partial [Kamptonema sp. SIO4C4]|nr:family 10 glycosylhydrolase [Kamptonema sp. SIO4C4]